MARPKGIPNKNSKTKIVNDQGELRSYLRDKDYHRAWNLIKGIAMKAVATSGGVIDKDFAYLLFLDAAEKYDEDKSDNFILFYKTRLKHAKLELEDRNASIIIENRKVINSMRRQSSSPKDDWDPFTSSYMEFM